jgi:hypothetical protein
MTQTEGPKRAKWASGIAHRPTAPHQIRPPPRPPGLHQIPFAWLRPASPGPARASTANLDSRTKQNQGTACTTLPQTEPGRTRRQVTAASPIVQPQLVEVKPLFPSGNPSRTDTHLGRTSRINKQPRCSTGSRIYAISYDERSEKPRRIRNRQSACLPSTRLPPWPLSLDARMIRPHPR